jgi:hypothetical protein
MGRDSVASSLELSTKSPSISRSSTTSSMPRRRTSHKTTPASSSSSILLSSAASPSAPSPTLVPLVHYVPGEISNEQAASVSHATATDIAFSAAGAADVVQSPSAVTSESVPNIPLVKAMNESTTQDDILLEESVNLSAHSSPSSRSSTKRASVSSRGAQLLRRSLRSTSTSTHGGILGILFPWVHREPEELDEDVHFVLRGSAAPFAASKAALYKLPALLLTQLCDNPSAARDADGSFVVDRACPQIRLVLDFIHSGKCVMPAPTTEAWAELLDDATYINVEKLVKKMHKTEAGLSTQDRERLRIARLKMEFARTKAALEAKQMQRRYVYNVLIVGVSGSGKSSSLNSILNSQACAVSGAQAQGTRGTQLCDGVIDDESFLSYVDTQGL